MNLIVRKQVKGLSELNFSADALTQIETEIKRKVKQAENRALANSRKTILARDI